MKRFVRAAIASILLCAQTVHAGTDGIHIHQLALRCRSGSRNVAYIELQADSTGITFDASIGWTLLNSKGVTLLDVSRMFGSATNSPWTPGQDWLLAGSVFRALTGVAPDGAMAVAPDTAGGSVIVYRLGTDGVTRTTIDRLDYGASAGTPIPTGVALTRQPDLSWAVDWNPRPRNFSNLVPDLVTCFGDSIPMPQIRRVATRCADGSSSGSLIELTPLARGITFDSGIQLSVFDHAGRPLMTLPRPFGINTDRAWARGRSFLLAPAGFSDRTGMTTDGVLPLELDPDGGSMDLSATAGPVVLHRTLKYGAGTRIPRISPGRDVVWLSDTSYVDDPLIAMSDLSGATLSSQDCFFAFHVDSCPDCIPAVPAPICHPTYAPLSITSSNYWSPYSYASNFTRFRDIETNFIVFTVSCSFDLTRGFLTAGASSGFGYPIHAEDDIVLVGPDAGSPLVVTLRCDERCSVSHGSPSPLPATMSIAYMDTVHTSTITTSARDTATLQTFRERVALTPGVPFHLRYGFDPGHTLYGQSGGTQLTLSFEDIPAGYSLTSCHGLYQQGTAVVATQVASASAAATPGRAALGWRVLQPASTALTVQRTRDGSGWIDLATVLADGDGHVEYVDTNVQTGVRYGYRLRWSDTRTGMQTGGEVWAEIPSGYRFAMHRVSPNPSHGNVAIDFEIAEPGSVRVELIDVAGRCVASRVLTSLAAGTHMVPITPTEALPPGVYMARIRAGAHVAQSRVILIR